MKWLLGIDIGGTKTNIGIVKENGRILAQRRIPSNIHGGISGFVEKVHKEIDGILAENNMGLEDIEDIGIGIPGTVDRGQQVVEYSSNLFGSDVAIGSLFEKELGRRVTLIQDSWAAAWGERLFGAGKRFDDFFCVSLGTGIGCGIISEGKIFMGTMDCAGEIGHTPIIMGGRRCSCGNYGCLESYASGTGILKQAMERFPEKLRGEESTEKVFELAEGGDAAAIALIDDAVEKLAYGLAILVNLFAIDTFLISGGLCIHKERIIDPLPSLIEKHGYHSWSRKKRIKVLPAELGSDAPMIGAAFINQEGDAMSRKSKELIFFSPVPRDAIWGGTLLKEYFHYKGFGDRVGQSWSFSAQKDASNRILNESYRTKTLADLWEQRPELFESKFEEFPFIISLVAPAEDLSIQVHPGEGYARRKGFSTGKNEAWYFIRAEKGSSILYGHRAEDERQLRQYMEKGDWDGLACQKQVKEGEFVYIPAGTLHALKRGSIVYEVQQATDVTYRFYDYGRMDEKGNRRELHLEDALACISYHKETEHNRMNIIEKSENCMLTRYHNDDSFCITKAEFTGAANICFETYQLATVISGSGMIEGIKASIGESFLIPSGYGDMSVDGNLILMLTSEKQS